jgi:hypothetical protein
MNDLFINIFFKSANVSVCGLVQLARPTILHLAANKSAAVLAVLYSNQASLIWSIFSLSAILPHLTNTQNLALMSSANFSGLALAIAVLILSASAICLSNLQTVSFSNVSCLFILCHS